MNKSKIYTKSFYEHNRTISLRSAQHVVPEILKYFHPHSVIDIGCGTGTWLSVFKQQGLTDIFGLDGDYVDRKMLLIPTKNFQPADLKKNIYLNRQYDLAVSMEVAEHIPEKAADIFVKNLTGLAPVIIFSAAIPGQGGDQHINEQWQSYWAKKFQAAGYVVIDCLREKLWNNEQVEFFYSQNIFFFVAKNKLTKYPKLQAAYKQYRGKPLNLVHPKMFSMEAARLLSASIRPTLLHKIINKTKKILKRK